MSKKEKRKPRTKEVKNVTDEFKPLDFSIIGSDNDPCFGKLHSLKADECRRCGDSELCQMAMAMKLHQLRAKEESKGNYLDIEETKKDIKNRTFEINGVHEYIFKILGKYGVEKSYPIDRIATKLKLKFNIELDQGVEIIKELVYSDSKGEQRLLWRNKRTKIKLIKP